MVVYTKGLAFIKACEALITIIFHSRFATDIVHVKNFIGVLTSLRSLSRNCRLMNKVVEARRFLFIIYNFRAFLTITYVN